MLRTVVAMLHVPLKTTMLDKIDRHEKQEYRWCETFKGAHGSFLSDLQPNSKIRSGLAR